MADLVGPIQHKRGTTAQWAASQIPLRDGELGIDSTLRRMKVGDGSTLWAGLPWASTSAADIARLEAAATALQGATAPTDAAMTTIQANPNSAFAQAQKATIDAAVQPAVTTLSEQTKVALRSASSITDAYTPRAQARVMATPPTVTFTLSTESGASAAYDSLPLRVSATDATAFPKAFTGWGLIRGARTLAGVACMMNVANGHYTATDFYPTGTPSTFALETDFYGDVFSMKHLRLGSADKFQVFVDGEAIAVTPTAFPTVSDTTAVFTRVTFASVALRRIRLVLPSNFALASLATHNALHTFRSPAKRAFPVFALGDSWVEGARASSTIETTIAYLRPLTGWEIYQGGQSGTAFGVPAADSTLGSTPFGSVNRIRALAEAHAQTPGGLKLVIIAGTSNNDTTNTTDLTGYVRQTIQAARTAAPGALVILIGPQSTTGTPTAARLARRDAIKAGADAEGAPFIDRIAEQWITGDGRTGAPGTSGNASGYVAAEGSHLNSVGQRYEAGRWLEGIMRVLAA